MLLHLAGSAERSPVLTHAVEALGAYLRVADVPLGYPFVQRCNLFRRKSGAQTGYLLDKFRFSVAVDRISLLPSTFGELSEQLGMLCSICQSYGSVLFGKSIVPFPGGWAAKPFSGNIMACSFVGHSDDELSERFHLVRYLVPTTLATVKLSDVSF